MSAFDKLMESIVQHDEIRTGARAPSRETLVTGTAVKAIRAKTKLSQAKFAKLILIEVGTLKNWEQGRREPTGPAKALLKAIDKNPEAVVRALHA